MKTVEDIQKLVYNVEHGIPVRSPSMPINESNSSATYRPNTNNSQLTYTQTPNTSSYSPANSTYKTRKYRRSFNSPNDEYAIAGFSIGYVQKQWIVKENGESTKIGYWDDSKHLSGIQVGFRVEPLFKYGFGINKDCITNIITLKASRYHMME